MREKYQDKSENREQKKEELVKKHLLVKENLKEHSNTENIEQ